MVLPLMPKAIATWLIDNTALSFTQISEFCGLHELEVQSIADGDVAVGITGENPVHMGMLTYEEIEKASKDPKHALQMNNEYVAYLKTQKKKSSTYTPVARRNDKPDAIMWLLKNHSTISDGQIIKLIGTTKKTIQAIKDREHWNITNIKPRDPVLLGLCTQTDLQKIIDKLEEAEPKKKEA